MDGSYPVKLFRHGANQAVDIPQAFELPGDDVTIRKEGQRLIIEPVRKRVTGAEFAAFLSTLEPIDEEIDEIEDYPPRPFSL